MKVENGGPHYCYSYISQTMLTYVDEETVDDRGVKLDDSTEIDELKKWEVS